MYLVALTIASLLLTFDRPLRPWVDDPINLALAVSAAALLPALLARFVAVRCVRAIEAHPEDPSLGQARLGSGMALVQWLMAALQSALLLATGWLDVIAAIPFIGRWVLVPSLVASLPFLVSAVLVWSAVYPADRAIRQIALEVFLFRGKPVRPVWRLIDYVVFNLRHQVLFVMVPMFLIIAARDLLERNRLALERVLPDGYLTDLLLGAATIVVAIIAPSLLRHIWLTQRLPDGPLRDRLRMLCRKLRLRCREILVWRTGGMLVNAAVMGVLAPFRYVMITDGMLEQLEDRKIEAVFGHEAGHVKRHHILFFLLFAGVSGCLATIFSIRAARLDPIAYNIACGGLVLVLGVKWLLGFGWLSRRFERQADIFGVRTLALLGQPCALPCAVHGSQPDAANAAAAAPRGGLAGAAATAGMELVSAARADPRGDPLCSTAAHIFGDTLHDVARLNGIPPEGRSFRHGSIASRSRVLQALALDPLAAARFEREVSWIKAGILLAATAVGFWCAYELKLWRLVSWIWHEAWTRGVGTA